MVSKRGQPILFIRILPWEISDRVWDIKKDEKNGMETHFAKGLPLAVRLTSPMQPFPRATWMKLLEGI